MLGTEAIESREVSEADVEEQRQREVVSGVPTRKPAGIVRRRTAAGVVAALYTSPSPAHRLASRFCLGGSIWLRGRSECSYPVRMLPSGDPRTLRLNDMRPREVLTV
jgi:hypothetical protein